MKDFSDILTLARHNVATNPNITSEVTEAVVDRYLKGLVDEVNEVKAEVKANNEIYLKDELSDIVWDFSVLVAILESRGYLEKVEDIFTQAHAKYEERSPAFQYTDDVLWEEIKQTQKERLAKQHQEKYGL